MNTPSRFHIANYLQPNPPNKEEKQVMQEKVWQLHLSCLSQRQITDATGTPQKTINDWVSEKS